jgi:hypothetical protein
LVAIANDLLGCCDLNLGGLNLASLVLPSIATICNLLGRGLYVDCCLLSPPWLQSSANDPFGHRDLDLGGFSLAFLVLAFLTSACNPLGHSPHVGHHLVSPPF